MIYRDSFVLNWCLLLPVSKTEERSLEHLSKQSVDDNKVLLYRFLILTKVFIYFGCQMLASLIASQLSHTKLYRQPWKGIHFDMKKWSFNEKIHCSFSLVKINLTFRLSRNLLQSWSTFFCVILDCSPSNGSLKNSQTCQNNLLPMTTNVESVEANSHTVVTR